MFLNSVVATISFLSNVTEALICDFDPYGYLVASDGGIMAYDQDDSPSGNLIDYYMNKVLVDPITDKEYGISAVNAAMFDVADNRNVYSPSAGDLNTGMIYDGVFSMARIDSDAEKLIIYDANGGSAIPFFSDYHYSSEDLLSLTTNPLDGSLVAIYGNGVNTSLFLYTIKLDSARSVFHMSLLSEANTDLSNLLTVTGADLLKASANTVKIMMTWTSDSSSHFGYRRLDENYEVVGVLTTLDSSTTLQYKSVTPCKADFDVAVHEEEAYPDFASTDKLCQEGYIRTNGDDVMVLYDSSDMSYGIKDVGHYVAVDVLTKEIYTTDIGSSVIQNYSTGVATTVVLPAGWVMTGTLIYGTFYIVAVDVAGYTFHLFNPVTDSEWTELTPENPAEFTQIKDTSIPIAVLTEPSFGALLIAASTPSVDAVGVYHMKIDVANAKFMYSAPEFTGVNIGPILGQTGLVGAAVYERELPAQEGSTYTLEIGAVGFYGDVTMGMPLNSGVEYFFDADFDNAYFDERYTTSSVEHCMQQIFDDGFNAYGEPATTSSTTTSTTTVNQWILDHCNCGCSSCVRCKFPQCNCGDV